MSNVLFHTSGAQKVTGMWPTLHALADEGALYIVTSTDAATGKAAGTGIATTTSVVDDAATASATHAQNVPVLYLANTAPVTDTDAKSIYPLWMRFTVTAAPTSASVWSYAMRGDYAARYTSGGTRLNPINVNLGASGQSQALCYFGAVITALPSGSQRVLSSGQIQSTIPVVKDQWIFTFGDFSAPTNVLTASAAKNLTIPVGPMVISPGTNFTLEMWGTSCGGAPAWEFEMGYAERVTGL